MNERDNSIFDLGGNGGYVLHLAVDVVRPLVVQSENILVSSCYATSRLQNLECVGLRCVIIDWVGVSCKLCDVSSFNNIRG